MVWFLVDDNLTFHNKVIEAGNEAMGLWVRAGAWSAANLTNGKVPPEVAHKLARKNYANRLVEVGLWSRVTDDVTYYYEFHDWHDCQPDADQVKHRREQARQRKARQRERDTKPEPLSRSPSRETLTRAPDQVPQGLGNKSHQRDGAATSADGARGARAPNTDQFTEIANCDLCDDDGRKPNGMVCDHIDRRFTAAHGSKQIRQQMGWKT